MDILVRLNTAIEFIEENLAGKIDYEEVAKICYCSAYNFHRMFNFITGISVTEYVRNRRMTAAAFELQERDRKVIDLALKYGYDSPVSFARAFKAVHKVTPSQAKRKNTNLKAYPKMSFQIKITGDCEMNYRIEEKKAFKVFGVEKEILDNGDTRQIPDFFTACIQDGSFGQIQKRGNENYPYAGQPSMSGICNYTRGGGPPLYMVGWLVFDDTPLPQEFKQLEIPASTWVIFESETYQDGGDDVEIIQGLWRRIYQEWLPASEYELADLPQIEQDHYQRPDSCFVEIWLPLQKGSSPI